MTHRSDDFIRVRTTAVAIYKKRKTPHIADANGISDAG